MDTEPPRFRVGEYIILTQPCLGLPAQSVGVITRLYSTDPPHYLIHFGVALPDGPFPQTMLSRLRSAYIAHEERSA
jgi:hypothetical protein